MRTAGTAANTYSDWAPDASAIAEARREALNLPARFSHGAPDGKRAGPASESARGPGRPTWLGGLQSR